MKNKSHEHSKPTGIARASASRGGSSCCWIGLLFCLLTSSNLLAQTAKEAARSFQEGRYEDALEIYRHLALENPEDARFTYNAGVAAYKAGQIAEAMEQFDAASLAPDLSVQQQAHYNMGNALYRAGESATEFEQKAAAWKQAVQRYQHALTIDETDSLAEDNLSFVKQQLEELEQQQQEQQQDQEENEDDSEQDQNSESDQQEQENEEQSDQSEQQEEQQDQSESSQSEQNEEQNQEQQENQQQSGEENPEEQQQQNPEESTSPESGDPSQQQMPQEGKMTPEQARQLLDAERDQAQAMIFRPPQEKKSKKRTFKDW